MVPTTVAPATTTMRPITTMAPTTFAPATTTTRPITTMAPTTTLQPQVTTLQTTTTLQPIFTRPPVIQPPQQVTTQMPLPIPPTQKFARCENRPPSMGSCPRNYSPVTCPDGRTYSNSCVASGNGCYDCPRAGRI